MITIGSGSPKRSAIRPHRVLPDRELELNSICNPLSYQSAKVELPFDDVLMDQHVA
jgi:hypothetical protein